jgi:hypothetical protein
MATQWHTRREQIIEVLGRFLPAPAVDYAYGLIITHQVHLVLTRERTTKYGDYRAPVGKEGHRISVNQTLNPYAMLVTLLHEFAHLKVWEKYRHKVRPHGEEWKRAFAEIMKPVLNEEIFPHDVLGVLQRYLINPAASSCSDPQLMAALSAHNPPSDYNCLLRDLPEGTLFALAKGHRFRKGAMRRTRCICTCEDSRRNFLILASTRVRPLE